MRSFPPLVTYEEEQRGPWTISRNSVPPFQTNTYSQTNHPKDVGEKHYQQYGKSTTSQNPRVSRRNALPLVTPTSSRGVVTESTVKWLRLD